MILECIEKIDLLKKNRVVKKIFILLIVSSLFPKDLPPFQRTRDRTVDIHHIRINIDVSLKNKSVKGYVIHTLSPLSSNLDEIIFDAEDMNVRRVRLNGKDIDFTQDETVIYTHLYNPIGWEDTVDIRIDYLSYPKKGLYFISPDREYPNKRRQAWTQGEEEDNHHWVPIYDYPNDRSTFECILTVNENYTALSNGELLSKVNNKDSTHTWHWRENFPMVSYLISFVIGEYVKVEDSYNDLPVNYWVYEKNKDEALRSFGKTPDMIDFFNDKTGIIYPYEKYDQVITEDFMFLGMENITLSHYTDATIHDKYAVPDVSSYELVAHELAHQWYGNMITTRNWANIWLNEGFASYFARIYIKEEFGNEESEYLRQEEIDKYFKQDSISRHPTVYNRFYDPMDLFNAHVYEKGSLILNMINDELGDEGFWKSIQHYTKYNQNKNVETSDFKKSIELITGQNLDWFFNQWLFEGGYPEFKVSWSYNPRNENVRIKVEQVQDLKESNIFRVKVGIRLDESVKTFMIDQKEMVFDIHSEKRPKLVVFNTGNRIPCKLYFEKNISEWILQLQSSPDVLDRISAARTLSQKKGRRNVEEALLKSLGSDPFWGVRKEAAKSFSRLGVKKYEEKLIKLTQNQDNRVKREIYSGLKIYKGNKKVAGFLNNVIENEDKYYGIADAFRALVQVDSGLAKTNLEKLLNMDSHNDVIRKAAISYYGSVINENNFKKLKDLSKYGNTTWKARTECISQFEKYVKLKPETVKIFIDFLEDPSRSLRQRSVYAIAKFGDKTHIDQLDRLAINDPILSRDVRYAKQMLNKPKGTKKSIQKKEIEKLKLKLKQIETILK